MVMFPFNMKYMKQKSPAASTCKRNVEEEQCLPYLVHSCTKEPPLKFDAALQSNLDMHFVNPKSREMREVKLFYFSQFTLCKMRKRISVV